MLNCTSGESRQFLLLDQIDTLGMIERDPPEDDARFLRGQPSGQW